MKFIRRRPFLLAAAVLLLVTPAGAPAFAQGDAASPWSLLEELRAGLKGSGPMTSRFVQTYVPAGFDTGDEETGQLSMWFPDCLRWHYEPPQDKSFLICQGEVYSWSEDEPGGRRYKIDPREEPGLDLLLVPVETLRERYVAASEKTSDGAWVIVLETPPSEDGNFTARFTIDGGKKRVLGLEYTDTEGNLTRFVISDYQTLGHTALFQPPEGIEWTEE